MKKFKKLFIFFLTIGVFLSVVFFVSKNKKLDEKNNLINISNLSSDFMENYFEEVQNISNEDKENMLIITSIDSLDDTFGATKVIEAPNNQYFLQYDSKEKKELALEELNKDSSLISIEENTIYTIEEQVSYNSWGVEAMSLDYAQEIIDLSNVEQVNVAIIDSGCDMELFNKYFSGKIVETYNVLEDSTSIMSDENGHGTHIAGTIAESTPSNVKIIPIKAGESGTFYVTDLVAAINYVAYYKKADVVNMSFGSYGNNASLEQAIAAANEENIIFVASAGNSNSSYKHYPSGLDTTISIASIDSELNKSTFSNYGSSIDFTAPGTNIRSIMGKDAEISIKNNNNDDDDHEVISGTSMATPHAVSAVAILKSYNKDLTLEDVKELLKTNAIDLGEKGWDEYYGYGLISFKDIQFCDNKRCDEYGVFKDLTVSVEDLSVVEKNFTPYNYYSLTNILGFKIKVDYNDETSKEILLSDLENFEILNYDPYSTIEQTIIIKVDGLEFEVKTTNPSSYSSGWEYSVLSSGAVELTGYKEHGLNISRLYIPEYVGENPRRPVVALADNVKFIELSNDFETYEYLYLPSTFNKFGDYSLSKTGIKYVYGDNQLVDIGAHAFEESLITTLGVTLKSIDEYAFYKAYELITVNVSGKITGFGEYAFYDCKKLIEVKNINDVEFEQVGNVGKYAFYNCISLSTFEFKILDIIEEYAFMNTHSLISIDLYSLNDIGKYAFYESGISEAKLGLINVIEESTFEKCRNLKSMSITTGRIEKRAFYGSGIEYISLGRNVEYIAEDAFAYASLKNNDGGNDGTGKYNPVFGVGIIETATNTLLVGYSDNSAVKIPDYVTQISDYAYTGNSSLESIIIPDTIQKIGEYSFKDCYSLNKVYMLAKNIQIGEEAFVRTNDGEIKEADLLMYVYKESDTKKYAKDNNIIYRHIEPDEIIVTNDTNSYVAMSGMKLSDLNVKLIYNEEEVREEVISEFRYGVSTPLESEGIGYSVKYQNSWCFNYGDTYYIVEAINEVGYEITTRMDVIVTKAKIDYKYEVSDNTVNFDGNSHGINLKVISPSNAKVLYADEEGNYILDEMPKYKDVGKYVIKYMLYINDNYEVEYGENTLTIIDPSSYNLSTDYEGVYDGKEHTFNLNINLDEYTIKYSIGNTNYDLDDIPKFTEVGEYTINYKIIYNSNVEIFGTNKVKIYGIKSIDENIVKKDNLLLITDQKNDISEITNRIEIYSTTSTVTYYDKDNSIVESGTIGTGSKVVININGTNMEYNISILGDVTGDGIVNIADVVKIADHSITQNVLNKDYEILSADVTGDNIINIADVVKIADHTLDNSIKLWR